MFGSIYFARPQIADQQLITAEHIQRQKTIMVIVAVKEASLLATMHGIIGGVEIEDQLFGGLGMGGNEIVNQHLLNRKGFLPAYMVLEATQYRRASQGLIFAQSYQYVSLKSDAEQQAVSTSPSQVNVEN